MERRLMISKGRAICNIGDEHNEVDPGSITLIPAGVEHHIEPLGSEVVVDIDVVDPARDDYLFLLRWMR
jgi:mannose-6-phosphate isomerase-like protein (cupin superfamily)